MRHENPLVFGQLVNLEVLILGTTRISGSNPLELTMLPRLRVVGFSHMDFRGPLHPQFGAMPALQRPEGTDTRLSVPIPVELAKAKRREILAPGQNRLVGFISQATTLKPSGANFDNRIQAAPEERHDQNGC